MMQEEKFDRWIYASAALHVAFGIFVFVSPSLFPISGSASWGTSNAGGDGVNVRIVSNFTGIALPSPAVVTEDAAANDSPGLYKSEPSPPPEPVKNAIAIPDPKATVKKTPPKPASAPASTKPDETQPPSNAVPYGQGGRPDLQYGAMSNGSGSVGARFGEGAFGERYGWYVQSMTRKISENWLKAMVDASVRSAPRVYLRFVIARNGDVIGVEVQQSSSVPTLDATARRAILRSSPLPPLPPDYRGDNVTVSFYFEYAR